MPRKKEIEAETEGKEEREETRAEEPPIVTADTAEAIAAEPPKPRRRRSKEEIAREREERSVRESQARLEAARPVAAQCVGMVDALLAAALPPPLADGERALLEGATARFLASEDADKYMTPGWMLVAALAVVATPRILALLRRKQPGSASPASPATSEQQDDVG